jgi:P-type Ca2+ transporter type 2C
VHQNRSFAVSAKSQRDSFDGLTQADIQARQKEEGFNELPHPDRRTPFGIVVEVIREPMLVLLLAAGMLYLTFGNLGEALVLLALAMMSVLITVIQESRTERVLDALRDLTSPRALVIRDGERVRIAGREVVRGDLVVLNEGDRVPADAVLVQSSDLQTDESLLTGESVPVRKLTGPGSASTTSGRPGGDDLPLVFSGTLIVRGTGIGEVTATGVRSEIGRIGQSLNSLETEPPRLQAQIRRLVRVFLMVGGPVVVLAVLLYGTLRGGWLDAVLAGIALAMSMLPEELPIVLTVFMAMGAWRMSQSRVLTRRASAIESLGSATVLCTDKTGTLTENRMVIVELRLGSDEIFKPGNTDAVKLPGRFPELVEFGCLASAPVPFDPMDKAFHGLAQTALSGTSHRHGPEWQVAHAYGLRPDLLAMTQVWQSSQGEAAFIVAAKGAPEAIADLCRLSAADLASLTRSVDAMAADGLRVLGVARASHEGKSLPDTQRGFTFQFLGLVGLADPLRSSVPEAVSQCRSAGIKVIMITGDYPATAKAIAAQAGIGAVDVISGAELDKLNEPELASRVRTATVFARVMPEQKLRIVKALKANGEIVAMTGDGVNDAPSLKAAHIGIAMGGRGTDVAREASAIVLLDDDFGSIVKAVRLGRRIYDNLRKAIGFIFAVHVPIAGLALLPLLFGLPILLGPIHIAFLEMLMDPICSLAFEAETEEDDVMRRPPHAPDAPLFSAPLIVWSVVQGMIAFILVAAIFVISTRRGMPETEVRSLTFFALVMSIIGLTVVNRSFSASLRTAFLRPNPSLKWILAAVVAMLALTLLWPFAGRLFRFGPLHLDDLALVAGAGLLVVVILEFLKPHWRARLRS